MARRTAEDAAAGGVPRPLHAHAPERPDARDIAPQPLAGLRVVEFTHMVMGPTCGMVLADLGAEVIKVEPIEGDNTRRLLGAGAGFFPMFNRNKKSIAIDLRSADGVDVARKLVRERRRRQRELPARHDGEVRPRLRHACEGPTRASSTSATRASCPARTNIAPRSTRSCR